MATTKAFELAQLSANVTSTTGLSTLATGIVSSEKIGAGIAVPLGNIHSKSAINNLLILESEDANADIIGLDASGSTRLRSAAGAFSFWAGGDANSTGAANSTSVLTIADDGIINVASTASSTGSSTGALMVAGGVGVGENLYVGGNIVISGDLTVEGSQVTLNTTALDVEDKNITLNYHASNDTSASAGGAGITIQDAVDASNDASILWNATGDRFDFSHAVEILGDLDLSAATTETRSLQIGNNRSGDGISLIDLVGDATYSDYGFRVQRAAGENGKSSLLHHGTGNLEIRALEAATIRFKTTDADRMQIKSGGDIHFYDSAADVGMVWDAGEGTDGALLIGGHTDLRAGSVAGRNDAQLSLESTNYHNAIFVENQNTANGYHLVLGKTRGTAVNAVTIVQAEDEIGSLTFAAADGTDLRPKVAQISAYVSAGTTPATNAVSGELRFGTTSQAQDTTTHMVLNKDGRLGIGTLLPETMLDVQNSSTALYTSNMSGLGSYQPSSSDMIQVRNTHTGLDDIYAGIWFETGTGATNTTGSDRAGRIALVVDNDSAYSSNFVFQTRSANAELTEKMRITQDGNVGIGTNIPNQLLHVKGASPFTRIESNSTSYNGLSMVNASGNFYFGIDDTGGNFYGDASARAIYSDGAYPIVFYTNATKRVVIDATGKTGIGNDSPTYDLDVTGQGRFTTDLRLGSENLRLSTDGSGEFGLGYGTTHTTANRFRVYQNTTPVFSVRDDGAIDTTQVRHSIRPSLNLDFANSKELDSRITFYRDSIATYYDSKGVLKYANVNEPRFDHDPVTGESKGLLIEEARTNISRSTLNHGILGYLNCFGIPNVTIAPDGSHTALLVQNIPSPTSVTCVFINALSGVSAGQVYTCSIYLKAGPNPDPSIWAIYDGLTSVNYGSTNISWSNGVPTATNNAVVTSVGNGWYRISVVATVPAGKTDMLALLYPSSGGAGNKNVYCWGSQFELGAFATSYIPITLTFTSRASNATYHDETGILRTAPVNGARHGYKYDGRKWVETGLILEAAATNRKQNFISSAGALQWSTNQNSEPVADYTVKSPDDSYSTIRQKINSTANAIHSIYDFTPVTAGTQLCFSVYAKAAEYNRIYMYTDGIVPTIGGVFYDLSNGTIGGLDAIPRDAYGIEDVGNGWYRCWYSGTPTSGTTAYWHIDIAQSDSTRTFVGTVGQGLYLWGPQMEYSGALSSYIYTDTSDVTRAADVASSVAYTRDRDTADIDKKHIYDFYGYPYPEETTVFVEASMANAVSNDGLRYPLQLSGDNPNDAYENILFYNASNDLFTARVMTTNGQNVIQDNSTNVIVADIPFKAAISLKNGAQAYAFDGVAEQTNTAAYDPPQINAMRIGGWCHGSARLCGHVKKVSIYNTALSSSEITALTENN